MGIILGLVLDYLYEIEKRWGDDNNVEDVGKKNELCVGDLSNEERIPGRLRRWIRIKK